MPPLEDGKKILIFINYKLHLIPEQIKKDPIFQRSWAELGLLLEKKPFANEKRTKTVKALEIHPLNFVPIEFSDYFSSSPFTCKSNITFAMCFYTPLQYAPSLIA